MHQLCSKVILSGVILQFSVLNLLTLKLKCVSFCWHFLLPSKQVIIKSSRFFLKCVSYCSVLLILRVLGAILRPFLETLHRFISHISKMPSWSPRPYISSNCWILNISHYKALFEYYNFLPSGLFCPPFLFPVEQSKNT